jgi:hypothetical protein
MNTHDTTGEPKTGDRMFELMDSDKAMMEEKYGVEVVGWCTDNGPDAKKGQRLLSKKFTWMIILLCWAHQLNLIVRDVLGVKHKLIDIMKTALTIITWFNNHSAPLSWLQAEQIITNGKALIIFLPVITRWLTHYHAISQLLDIEGAAIFGLVRQGILLARQEIQRSKQTHVRCSSQLGTLASGINCIGKHQKFEISNTKD